MPVNPPIGANNKETTDKYKAVIGLTKGLLHLYVNLLVQ